MKIKNIHYRIKIVSKKVYMQVQSFKKVQGLSVFFKSFSPFPSICICVHILKIFRTHLVEHFKHMFLVFKQHYTHFHILFHSYIFQKNINNITQISLSIALVFSKTRRRKCSVLSPAHYIMSLSLILGIQAC